MMNKKIPIFNFLMSFLLIFNAWADDSGCCNSNCTCTWEKIGTFLTITGTDNAIMQNYNSPLSANWGEQVNLAPWGTDITSVNVTGSFKKLGNYAFWSASNLTSVNLPDSLTEIGTHAFMYASSLENLTIPSGVTSIGGACFYEATSLNSVNIPSGVTSIANGAFRQNNLTSITIPDSVTSIGQYAFLDNKNLTTINFGDNPNLKTIANAAFQGLTSLTSLTIPDSVTSIASSAFSGAKNLTDLIIGNSITTIENNTFKGAEKLTNLIIGDSVKTIDWQAFYGASSLRNLIIPDSVVTIGNNAFGQVRLADLTVSAENLQKYLDVLGGFTNGNINISCSSGDCKAVLEAWDAAHNTTYASRATIRAKSEQVQNADGSTSVYENGQLVATRGKRIYTVEEASRLSKDTGNTFKLRYK